jgi:hypothetical protein
VAKLLTRYKRARPIGWRFTAKNDLPHEPLAPVSRPPIRNTGQVFGVNAWSWGDRDQPGIERLVYLVLGRTSSVRGATRPLLSDAASGAISGKLSQVSVNSGIAGGAFVGLSCASVRIVDLG